jgi:alpha-methylacyl-CoA racemase
LASQMMADMGAEVIKIEPPGGEELRTIGPAGKHGHSAYFDAVNAGKSGIELNLKNEQDKFRLLELLRHADVMLESFRPGVLDKLGLSIEFLRQHAPGLIICSLNGYGENSPLQQEVGHDINYLAMNGVLDGTGTAQQAVAPWPPLADCSASLFGLSTVLAALLERERSGDGCHIEVALADSVLPLMAFSLVEAKHNGTGMPRGTALLNGGAARYRTYQTQDGKQIAIGAVEPKFWINFCNAADRPDWIDRINDALPQLELQQQMETYFAGLTFAECNDRFAQVDCCFNQVLNLAQAVETPHIQARQLLLECGGQLQALYPAYVDGKPPGQREEFKQM